MGLMAIVSASVRSKEDVEKVFKAVYEVPRESYISRKPRWLIVVDDDCDVRDWEDVMWRVSLGVMPDLDVKVGPRTDSISHEPLADIFDNLASSVVIDATFRSKQGKVKGKEGFPPGNHTSRELRAKIEARWKEYGLG